MKYRTQESYSVFLFISVYLLKFGVFGQKSPCPNVFEYKFDGHDWYGGITLPSVGRGRTSLNVTLNVEDNLSQDNTGQLILLNDINSLYATVDSGGLLQYKIVFPISTQIPSVLSIKLNKREYCANFQYETASVVTLIHAFQTDVNLSLNPTVVQVQPIPEDIPVISQPVPQAPEPQLPIASSPHFGGSNVASWLSSFEFSRTCGSRNEPENDTVPLPTIINGKPVDPGEYPWLVALYQQSRTYICGGSLVSNKHVITAAHCVNVRWLYVELGRHHLEDKYENVILRTTKQILIHPDYRPKTGHADIAVLILSESVNFNDKIKPICLWSFGTGGVGLTGIITGWGKDQSGDTTSTPMQTDVDIVDKDICLHSHEKFAEITSDNTICAGGKGKGPCLGDSGSGMYINRNERWYLRGVISISLGNKYTCDVTKYAVYADIATFLDWLRMCLVQ